ncbi:uncharacterized protein LOC125517321 [Triticum urartu]|uniref:uncharacterized protein LOC125517321 n=1 Tax=Triticum urartu TaxID=4572 RepID=UPI00204498C1|nr:uncharacterized protein LOC125517321 [Triticum urartu]
MGSRLQPSASSSPRLPRAGQPPSHHRRPPAAAPEPTLRLLSCSFLLSFPCCPSSFLSLSLSRFGVQTFKPQEQRHRYLVPAGGKLRRLTLERPGPSGLRKPRLVYTPICRGLPSERSSISTEPRIQPVPARPRPRQVPCPASPSSSFASCRTSASNHVVALLPVDQRTAPASVPPLCLDRARGARPVQPHVVRDPKAQLHTPGLPPTRRGPRLQAQRAPSWPAKPLVLLGQAMAKVAFLVSFGSVLEL